MKIEMMIWKLELNMDPPQAGSVVVVASTAGKPDATLTMIVSEEDAASMKLGERIEVNVMRDPEP